MKTRRFLVDENITPALADQLRRLQPEMEVMKIGDKVTPPKGATDPEILKWLESEGFSLITENRKSMPRHLTNHLRKGYHVPGIFTIRPKALMREVIDDILLIWELGEPEDYTDQIVHIPF